MCFRSRKVKTKTSIMIDLLYKHLCSYSCVCLILLYYKDFRQKVVLRFNLCFESIQRDLCRWQNSFSKMERKKASILIWIKVFSLLFTNAYGRICFKLNLFFQQRVHSGIRKIFGRKLCRDTILLFKVFNPICVDQTICDFFYLFRFVFSRNVYNFRWV